jgi:tol-pal system protein YbgF
MLCGGLTGAACAPSTVELERRRLSQQVDTLQNQLGRLDARVEDLAHSITLLMVQTVPTMGSPVAQLTPPPHSLRVEHISRASATTWPDAEDAEEGAAPAAGPAPRLLTLPREPATSTHANQLFEKALQNYQHGATAQACNGFDTWLRRFPDHADAPSAQFWLGECKFEQGDYAGAIAQFSRLNETYPRHAKASDALLKMGVAYERRHQSDKAATTFAQLIATYPQSASAELARARLRPEAQHERR